MRAAFPRVIVVVLAIFWGGCALNYFQADDPRTALGLGPKVHEIVKSLRCEITTFLVQNRRRQDLYNTALSNLGLSSSKLPDFYENAARITPQQLSYLNNLANITIDPFQYAAVSADFKNVHTTTLTVGIDVKSSVSKVPSTLGDTHTNRYAPGYTDTRTFQLVQLLNVAQNADLGPAETYPRNPALQRLTQITTTAYNPQTYQGIDADAFCYRSLVSLARRNLQAHSGDDVRLLEAGVRDLQSLVEGDPISQEFENFTRIYVGLGGPTLAKWLQQVSTETTLNERTITPISDRAILGQLQYQFVFNAKPTFNYKYTLILTPINPFVPDFTQSLEHAATFNLFLNTPTAISAFAAKQGNACYQYAKAGDAYGDGACKYKAPSGGASEDTLLAILKELKEMKEPKEPKEQKAKKTK